MSLIVDFYPKKQYVPVTRSDQDNYLTVILNFPKAFKNYCGYVSTRSVILGQSILGKHEYILMVSVITASKSKFWPKMKF